LILKLERWLYSMNLMSLMKGVAKLIRPLLPMGISGAWEQTLLEWLD
jgi:hypothetical protein